MTAGRMVLEVIVSSLDDVRAAAEGGADRVEVVAHLDQDGLTPARALVEAALAQVAIRLRVMVRPADVFTVTDPAARAAIVEDARQWAGLPIDGVVTGYVTPDGQVDEGLLRDVADASGQRVTFHRAIERVLTPARDAVDALRRVPAVDRILYGGGAGTWQARIDALSALQETAAPLVVIAGGGVDADAAARIAAAGVIGEVHVGRTVRTGQRVEGAVEARLVRQVLARIGRAESG